MYSNSRNAFEFAMCCVDTEMMSYKELVYAFYLNQRNRPIGYYKLGEGGINSCIVDQRLLFTSALLVGASGIILLHNHPGGTKKPSMSDLLITKKCVDTGKVVDIPLLDHLIIVKSNDDSTWDYLSMADEGLL